MATAVPPRCDANHNFCDDSERFRKATGGGLLAFRSHPNERGTERAEAESVLCLCACAVAAVVRARLRTALIERHLAIVNPLFVARLAAEPLLGGADRLHGARFAVGPRAGRKKSQRRPCNDKKPGTSTQILGRTRSKTAAHGLLPIRSAHAPTLPLRARPRLLTNAQQLGGEVSSCLFPEMPSNEPDLFALDVRGFEDRPPLLDLSLVVGRERLRILILARRNLLAEIGEPLAHAGIG
jgi:hypothetical protein